MSLLSHTYNGEYELMLKACGEGTLCDEDISLNDNVLGIIEGFRNTYFRYPNSISLLIEDASACGKISGFTKIDAGFLKNLKTLKELILPDSMKEIEMDAELNKIFKDNDVLIRGNFDSFAEDFAKDQGLNFRPSDHEIARHEYAPANQITVVTIIFERNGNIRMKEDINSPGSSGGNYFGATFYHELNREFYRTKTAEQVARQFRDVIYEQILQEGRLESFMEKARTHRIYLGKN